jgi:NADPH:quinone reductase-like Zn-dependent oxidoreductase
MKRYVIKPGEKGIEALSLEEMSSRPLKAHEVSVRVRAASLNYRDLINVSRGVAKELVPLSDGAGVVEEVGEDVTRLKKGDRVLGLFFPLWQGGEIDAIKFSSARGGAPIDGMLAQVVYGREDSFVKFPEYLSHEEASTLPCAGLTAWNALIVHGRLKPGETVLILGTGGVGIFGLQLAKSFGARAIMLSSKDEKLQKANEMGADVLINYEKNPNWENLVVESTSKIGADLVLELGGIGTLARSMGAARVNGRISMVGVLTGSDGQVNPLPIIRKSLSVKGIYVGSCDMQKEFHQALEANNIHPVIDRVFEFDQAKEAYKYMKSGQHFGKIVIRLV